MVPLLEATVAMVQHLGWQSFPLRWPASSFSESSTGGLRISNSDQCRGMVESFKLNTIGGGGGYNT
jgi:hypothetical protein